MHRFRRIDQLTHQVHTFQHFEVDVHVEGHLTLLLDFLLFVGSLVVTLKDNFNLERHVETGMKA